MPEISRAKLFGKLNPIQYKTLQGAMAFAKLRGNPFIEMAHWIHQMAQAQDSDLHRVCRHFELDMGLLARDLTDSIERLPGGATAINDLSRHIEDAVQRAWTFASLMYGANQIRGAHLFVAMLSEPPLRNLLYSISHQFERIRIEELSDTLDVITAGSPEQAMGAAEAGGAGDAGGETGAMAPAQMGQQQALRRFAVDLTERARQGEIDPVTGRDEEIRQIVDILMRRRQNNPLLTGEAGVGKTAVVEGFASRLARGDVPPQLRDVSLLALDIGLLQAGASMKGEFEQRLRQVIDEVQASPRPIILFIDEIHTLVGAGGAAGTGDAANLLKPALARGKLRTIGATTWAEYKKYIEKDPALTRRFQTVQIPEPDEGNAIRMLRGVAGVLEAHHRVLLLDRAIEAAVRLSHRYIPARQLPDKAVSLLDTACARVAISQHATPASLEDCQRRIEALRTELTQVEKELALGEPVADRHVALRQALDAERVQERALEDRVNAEKTLVDRILALRETLRAPADPDTPAPSGETPLGGEAPGTPDRQSLLDELSSLQAELAALQGDDPLILPAVDEQAIASVVADWTGIPVGRMVKNEISAVLRLAETLGERVIGQRHGLDTIARRIQTARARLDNPNKPIGVFMLVGPSGVGKTETALALAETLYGGEQNVITINMSEFQEAHTVSTLKGAPPGYVGYGEGGVLTEAVRRRPYSIVLLDEVEKAHPDVHEIFFQVFDKGWMEDGEGRYIDFKNTIILLTSNVGSELITNLCKDPELVPEPDAISTALREPLLKVFPAALLGRIVTVPYYPLSDQMLGAIVRLQLDRIVRRVNENHGVPLAYDDALIDLIISRCTELESGGRMIDSILTNSVLPRISVEYLNRLSSGTPLERIDLSVRDGDIHYAFG